MRKVFTTLALVAMVLLWSGPAHAQQFILSNTTLNGAVTATQQTFTLTSIATNVSSGSNATIGAMTVGMCVYTDGELSTITSVPTSGATIGVRRATAGLAGAHATLAVAIFGPCGNFYRVDPWASQYGSRACTATAVPQPYVNVMSGDIWLCRSSLWTATNPLLKTWNSSTLTP